AIFTAVTSYSYDEDGAPIGMSYPSGRKVLLQRDSASRDVTRVGTPASPARYASQVRHLPQAAAPSSAALPAARAPASPRRRAPPPASPPYPPASVRRSAVAESRPRLPSKRSPRTAFAG